MDESEGFDAERLRARIHENAKRRRSMLDHVPATPEQGMSDAEAGDLRQLANSADVAHVPFTSHHGILGPLIVLAKTLVTKLLTPVLTRQAAYNAASTRMLDAGRRERARLRDELGLVTQHQLQIQDAVDALVRQGAETDEQMRALAGRLQQRLDQLAPRHAEVQEQLGALTRQTGTLQDTLRHQSEAHSRALQITREQVASAERKLRRVLHALSDGQPGGGPRVSVPRAVPARLVESGFDYAGFEERFRGSEDTTKARQRVYLEYFKGRESVVEIGCGRGEFLELLREVGVPAKGVDLDLDMVLQCRDKGLDVAHDDALAHLESLPDDSLGGVFSAQVIEHLETARLARLIEVCHQKLRPGGVLVLETLNPECLFVLYRWFWIDPSHVRLVHPETLKFMLESAGFGQVECRFLPLGDAALPIPPLELRKPATSDLAPFNAATDYLNKLLYGSADYAVTGTK